MRQNIKPAVYFLDYNLTLIEEVMVYGWDIHEK